MLAHGAAITPDGLWVIYDSDASGTRTLWKISINGGPPVQLLARASDARISPDGKLIAARYKPDAAKDDLKAAIIPIAGGPLIRVLDGYTFPFDFAVQWSADSKSIIYRATHLSHDHQGIDDLWTQSIDGSRPKQLTHFDSNRIFSFAVSPGGFIALSRGVETRDLVLVKDF